MTETEVRKTVYIPPLNHGIHASMAFHFAQIFFLENYLEGRQKRPKHFFSFVAGTASASQLTRRLTITIF